MHVQRYPDRQISDIRCTELASSRFQTHRMGPTATALANSHAGDLCLTFKSFGIATGIAMASLRVVRVQRRVLAVRPHQLSREDTSLTLIPVNHSAQRPSMKSCRIGQLFNPGRKSGPAHHFTSAVTRSQMRLALVKVFSRTFKRASQAWKPA